MTDLKPCPFCGERPRCHMGFISCDNRGCLVQPVVSGNSLDEASTAWNHRPDYAALLAAALQLPEIAALVVVARRAVDEQYGSDIYYALIDALVALNAPGWKPPS